MYGGIKKTFFHAPPDDTYPGSGTGSDAAHSAAGDPDGDSWVLEKYFREMADNPLLTAEQEFEMWKRIDDSVSAMRALILRFGFVYSEHIRILSDEEADDISDIFPSSPDSPSDDITVNFQKRAEWCARIKKAFSELENAWKNGADNDTLEKLRGEGIAVMNACPVLQGKLLEWNDVAVQYLRNFKSGRLRREDLERRMLMSAGDFEESVAAVAKHHESFDALKIKMLESNLRFVINVGKRYRKRGLPLSDIIQEGNLGLMKALEKFNYRLGHRFCSYATWWIRYCITHALAAQGRVIRLPQHMLVSISRMNNAEKHYIQEHGAEPTDADIAQMLEMPVERVRAVRKMSMQCISLQAPVSNDGVMTGEDFIPSSESDDPMRIYAKKVVRERLAEAIGRLSEREQQLITMRYGLDGGECQSFGELSETFNVTRERIRQIEIKAIEKLRRSTDRGHSFDDFFI